MRPHALIGERKSAVGLLFAASAVPFMGLLGLAITLSFLTQAKSQTQLAADTAALNASKIAADWYTNNRTDWQANAQTTGQQWFNVQIGSLRGATISTPTVSVSQDGTNFNTTVTYSGSVPTYFAGVFGLRTLAFSGRATAVASVNAFLNVTLLIDNSSSMLIGATAADVSNLEYLTACSPMAGRSGQGTGAFSGTRPLATCPNTYLPTNQTDGSGNLLTTSNPGAFPVFGRAPNTAPCGFACHWSTNTQTGAYFYGATADQNSLTRSASTGPLLTSYDYFYLAQNPSASGIAGATPSALRLDVVYSAVTNVIQQMQSSESFADQFGVGVFMFNNAFTRVFPSTGEASTDLAAGLTAALGIQTPVVTNDGDTNFPSAMTNIANTLTSGGTGSTRATARKAMILITDGIQDYSPRNKGNQLGPMSNSAAVTACNAVKSKGISIYVLYTPYARVLNNPFYVSNIDEYVKNPPTPSTSVTALQACAGDASRVYQANSPTQIADGLRTLFQIAARAPARISS